MPSFDVVSKVDLMELDNAINTAAKELGQRYDFRGTNTSVERTPEGIIVRTSDEPLRLATRIGAAVRQAEPNLALFDLQTMESRARSSWSAGIQRSRVWPATPIGP